MRSNDKERKKDGDGDGGLGEDMEVMGEYLPSSANIDDTSKAFSALSLSQTLSIRDALYRNFPDLVTQVYLCFSSSLSPSLGDRHKYSHVHNHHTHGVSR